MTVAHPPIMASDREKKELSDILKFTDQQLEEFCERQRKILQNGKLLSKLKDGGEKLRVKLAAGEKELSRRKQTFEEAMDGLEKLSLVSEGMKADSENKKDSSEIKDELSTAAVNVLEDEAGSSRSSADENIKLPKYTEKLLVKDAQKSPQRKFKPFETLKHTNEIKPELAAKWQQFPDLAYDPKGKKSVCEISVKESVSLMAENQRRCKELEILEARNILMDKVEGDNFEIDLSSERFLDFRNPKSEELDSDDDVEEVGVGPGMEDLD